MVLDACPDIADSARGEMVNSRDFVATAALGPSKLGISPSDSEEAVEVMGERQVATMVAAVVGVAVDFGFNVGLENSPGFFGFNWDWNLASVPIETENSARSGENGLSLKCGFPGRLGSILHTNTPLLHRLLQFRFGLLFNLARGVDHFTAHAPPAALANSRLDAVFDF